ncbi:hypothetical protein RN04_04660 [Arthrobacter sp. W1]|nr:hypothetical protein RN04_04660 [Arthrobacter sp. W1]
MIFGLSGQLLGSISAAPAAAAKRSHTAWRTRPVARNHTACRSVRVHAATIEDNHSIGKAYGISY